MIDPEREEAELREYLGARFDRARLVDYETQLEDELAALGGDERRLYETSEAYLYNLTAFAMTRTKEPYLRTLIRLAPKGGRVLDYGCGIGSDGLVLAQHGFRVEFADFDNPSTRYLRWRLQRRGLDCPVHHLEAVPGGFDVAYSFDVIEHVDDPRGMLAELEGRGALVVVNFLEPATDETALHRPLPVAELVGHATRNGLRRYRVFHGRSHLVAYAPGGSALRARLELAAGRIMRPR